LLAWVGLNGWRISGPLCELHPFGPAHKAWQLEVNMNRRTFIRVVGGGVVLSATAGLAGCSREMPPEAIAAWQGPGSEPDVRKWILSYAILAPHSHNLQS
jgi:hypothetical protein